MSIEREAREAVVRTAVQLAEVGIVLSVSRQMR